METLYYNGDIITMEGEQDFAEAVLVADGKIKAVGTYDAVAAEKGEDCVLRDLEGRTLMPSFIDGHGHVTMAGAQYLTRANLEDAKNFDDIVAILKKYIADNNVPAGQPVLGCLYDHNYLEEGTHPDKKVLVVSHGGVCRIICNYFRDMENEEFVSHAFPNCGLEEFEL